MAAADKALEQKCINTIRTLSIDAIQKANSGHPGAPMGLAPAAFVLWNRCMKHNPANPAWIDRDRFVLSGGHASMLLYSMLYLDGYGLTIDDIKNFRQWESRTPGHPEYGHTSGVETTTGPLGQGVANAVGMAMAERHLAARFNKTENENGKIIDHFTYVMCGDGDLMEGVANEAISLAGHLGLGRLICLYDDNAISIEGSTEIAFTENVEAKFEAMNWHVISVPDGNDTDAIQAAIEAAQKETEKPSLVKITTKIAYGSPNKQGTSAAHGSPLGAEEIKLVKEFFGLPVDKDFYVADDVLQECRKTLENGNKAEQMWQDCFNAYKDEYPELAAELVDAVSGFLTSGWDKDIPLFTPEDKPIATRAASGKVLNAIASNLPALMGGSADLAPSNNTYLKEFNDFQKESYEGRNIRFGVREHAMGAIMSGMYLHGGIRPYGGTFLVFADYVRPAVRVASLMNLPLIYVFTHDSVAVGEDGPTHQPVEHVASLRIIPGLNVIRPADANETADAWKKALMTVDSPTALILSRQNLPVLDISKADGDLSCGAYILKDVPRDKQIDIILIASGSEVHLCVNAAAELEKENINARVISMPSWELFEKAPLSYRQRILPDKVKVRLAVEAGVTMGWEKYVGDAGRVIGINRFGASAPGSKVLSEYGITGDNIVQQAKELVNK
ncbi:transketolase 2, thiamin-binding [Desulfamplus magnetovallimortis]|uniref:Transketolase n=1 Tax=Desulfamplus magnetovallimortis TaxID=1246637 RepID=A0A1W1HHW1_9BACT|nr:transketolase [Desulfamplus magnetovallimortis]SLM32059.1 transketolase 2, thiamin-binding [Desulfamplus magnetovallimortis]